MEFKPTGVGDTANMIPFIFGCVDYFAPNDGSWHHTSFMVRIVRGDEGPVVPDAGTLDPKQLDTFVIPAGRLID